jgi:hypothetical protein
MNLKNRETGRAPPPLKTNEGTAKITVLHITFKVTVRRLVHFLDFRMVVSENAKEKMATLKVN